MCQMVHLKYNPFVPRLSITINDKPISDYSSLAQYTDEDIWKWKDSILREIYSEIREEFRIVFIGREFDADIIKSQCENYEYCLGFEYQKTAISETVQKRLVQLNKYLKNSGIAPFSKMIIKSYFTIDENLKDYREDIESIEIKNAFCSVKIITEQTNKEFSKDDSFIFVITEDHETGLRIADSYNTQNPIFVIVVGGQSNSSFINGKILVRFSKGNDLVNTIFDCFLDYPLILPIRNCIKNLPESYRNIIEIQKAYSIDPVIIIEVNSIVEVGRSNKIEISCEPNTHSTPNVIFKTLNSDIVSCDNRYIYGKSSGKTILEAYIPGDAKPFKTIEIQAIARNRIKKLILDEDSLVVGEGTSLKLRYDYTPTDADNVDCITWKSSDESIVSVDAQGRIKCKKTGECRIICLAENVSAQCMCTVRPYLSDIIVELPTLDDDSFTMSPMEEQILKVKTVPEDCIDGKLRISSSDSDIVNYVNGKLIAKNKGLAEITITNQSKSKSKVIRVKVKKKLGLFKRK